MESRILDDNHNIWRSKKKKKDTVLIRHHFQGYKYMILDLSYNKVVFEEHKKQSNRTFKLANKQINKFTNTTKQFIRQTVNLPQNKKLQASQRE